MTVGAANAATTIFTGSVSSQNDNWDVPANWNNGVPSGTDDVEISSGSSAQSNSDLGNAATYSGSLTLATNSSLKIIDDDDMGALGSGTINMNSSSSLFFRGTGGQDLSGRTFNLLGDDVTLRAGESTASSGRITFGTVTGAFDLTIGGNRNSRARFTTSHDFTNLTTLGDFGFGNDSFVLEAFAAGSLGSGTININETNALVLGAAGALTSANSLVLVGDNGLRSNAKVESDFANTVGSLTIDGSTIAPGIYDNTQTWFAGTGSLEVIPEPSVALLGSLGLLALLRRRR